MRSRFVFIFSSLIYRLFFRLSFSFLFYFIGFRAVFRSLYCAIETKNALPYNITQALMRAAGYGKSFLSDYDSDEFVECCRKLRVLNNCRHKAAGMPITSHQYDRLTPEVSYYYK